MTTSTQTTSDQLRNNSGNSELSDVILRLERYGVVMQQLPELSESLGIQYKADDISGTFTKIKDVIREHQQMYENEKQTRNQMERNIHELQQKLELSQGDKSNLEGRLNLLQQQVVEQEEIIKKLDNAKSETQRHYLEIQGRLLRALNEEKKRRISAENSCMETENKLSKESSIRRKTELNYRNAVATLNKQRVLLRRADQEKLELQIAVQQLERDKEHAELKCFTLQEAEHHEVNLENVLNSLDEIYPITDHLDGKEPAEHSESCRELNQWTETDRKRLAYRENKDIANALVLPPISTQGADMSLLYNGVGHLGHSSDRVMQIPQSGDEGVSIRKTDRQRWKYLSNLSSSVIPDTVMHNNSFRENNNHISFGNISPVSVGLVLKSESSDSATIEDLGFENSDINHHHYQQQQQDLSSYDYGAASSSIPYSEDYDSVNGNGSIQFQPNPNSRWVNPLQWAWERKGNVVEGVTSGVQNAARTGAKMSKNLWTWFTLFAVTTGSTIAVNRNGEILDADFSDSEEEDFFSKNQQASAYQAKDFIG